MAEQQFVMSSSQIAEIMGTVGSPLIVVSELLKNAVDASAENIDIYYNREEQTIAVENDHKGFTFEEIEKLSHPGTSAKKQATNLTNENGMFLTGSKGLGLLSVFLLCECAEIITAPKDKKIYRIILEKSNGTVEQFVTDQTSDKEFTKVLLKNVDKEIIDFLSSESEVRKLRHICTYLYKKDLVPFPTIMLHIFGQSAQKINFSCDFPSMLYDVHFNYRKETQTVHFNCVSPGKNICQDEVVFDDFQLQKLQEVMLTKYGIKDTIPTRSNELAFSDYTAVPDFEGRILVYEKSLAGAQLKAYGAGVNIYVNDFALYNYLAEENDWLGLADYSQRKKVTRLKPHNVFGYVNFPCFNENEEKLKISNERADFIQDFTFSKLMYLLKGVVMFAIFNIDVADKNPKYKEDPRQENPEPQESDPQRKTTPCDGDTEGHAGHDGDDKEAEGAEATYSGSNENGSEDSSRGDDGTPYSPDNVYKPQRLEQKSLSFTKSESAVIKALINHDDLSNKIYNVTFELSKLDLQVHRHSNAYLYRALLESATKYLSQHQSQVRFDNSSLEASIVSALKYLRNQCGKGKPLFNRHKDVEIWKDTVTKRKLIDALNQYVHNEQPVDALLLQETWNSMKGYIIACLTIQ
ncbi:ATP-binding protein [Intestinimonas butyriciproducens]|uniref:ATP-binding protein n=1 Tax=Intestinimonas butyriciproducens TaxID=1297617 RepID=UPI003AF075B5